MCAVCAVLGLGHPVLNCVEVLSRWEAVRKGTGELSVDSESCAEDEKGTSHAEGAAASSMLVHPEPGGASRRARAGRVKALFKTWKCGMAIHSSFSTFIEHPCYVWKCSGNLWSGVNKKSLSV